MRRSVPNIPFEADLRKIPGGQVIIKTLQRLFDSDRAVPFRVGASAIRSGVDSPERVEDGNIGDLYLRTDGSSAGTETRVGLPIAGSEGLGSLNAPTLYTKVRQNNSTRGWAAVGAWVSIQTAETGTINDWNPAAQTLLANTIIQWSGASALTITGLPKGYNGQLVWIQNVSSGQVLSLSHASANSSYGNRLTNWVTSGITPIAQNGSALYVYRDTTWTLVAHEQGVWITPTFAAGDYTGNGTMTWTVAAGDVLSASYHLVGKTVTYQTMLNTTTVGGTLNTQLLITWPNGWTTSALKDTFGGASDNGTVTGAQIITNTGAATTLRIFRDLGQGNWAASTDNTKVHGEITCEID